MCKNNCIKIRFKACLFYLEECNEGSIRYRKQLTAIRNAWQIMMHTVYFILPHTQKDREQMKYWRFPGPHLLDMKLVRCTFVVLAVPILQMIFVRSRPVLVMEPNPREWLCSGSWVRFSAPHFLSFFNRESCSSVHPRFLCRTVESCSLPYTMPIPPSPKSGKKWADLTYGTALLGCTIADCWWGIECSPMAKLCT